MTREKHKAKEFLKTGQLFLILKLGHWRAEMFTGSSLVV